MTTWYIFLLCKTNTYNSNSYNSVCEGIIATSWRLQLLAEGQLTKEGLVQAWNEAQTYFKGKGMNSDETSIDYDTFMRLNVRLDLIMDEIEAQQVPPLQKDGNDSLIFNV